MTRCLSRIFTRDVVVATIAVLLATVVRGPGPLATDSAAVAATAAPVVTGFRFRPVVLKPQSTGAFRFITSREGAGSIVLARVRRDGLAVPVGRLRFAVDAGDGRRAFDGQLAGRRLRAGRYRATVTVINAGGGRSAPRRAGFRIAAA